MIQKKTREELLFENQQLHKRLAEAEEIVRAIRRDKVDAVVVLGTEGNKVYTFKQDSRNYRILVETISEGTALTTFDGTIFCCNSRFAEMVGKPPESIAGSSIACYIPDKKRDAFDTLFLKGKKGSSKGEIHLKADDGALLPVHLSLNPLQMETTPGVCLVVTDLSEQKHNEEIIAARTLELQAKSQRLEEVNTALKILLKQREEDKVEFEEIILANVKNLIAPYLEKLKKTRLNDEQAIYCDILETHMNEIISPFVRKLSRSFSTLTAMEIQVADLIKEGKTTKEIAELLQVSENTVVVHRHRIRTKLKLKNTKANLASYLKSLTQ